jgi:hypothetical protein
MRYSRSVLAVVSFALLILLVACQSGQKNANTNNKVLGVATFKPTPVSLTPIPPAATERAATPVPLPSGTPYVGIPDPCALLSTGPQPPSATLPPPTPLPPFTPGPQPQRPAIDLSKLKLDPGTVPQGWDPLADGAVDATNLASVASYPQLAYAFLQQIGFLGGRAEAWTGQPENGRYPLLAIYYLVFANDAGASAFLRQPVYPANYCVRSEQGISLGMESVHNVFQYAGKLQTGNQGIFEGHIALWRCGRVVLSAQLVGAPGQYSASATDAIARKVQDAFVKTQPCS